MLRMFFTVAGPIKLLPYFLRYYIGGGVEHLVFSCYEPDTERYNLIRDIVDQHCQEGGATWETGFHDYKPMDWESRGDRVARIVKRKGWLDDWVLYPDLDEFVRWPKKPIREYLDSLPDDQQVVQGQWVDRCTNTGRLIRINPSKSLDEQFPCRAKLSWNIGRTISHVVVACRGVAPSRHHPKQGTTAKCKMNDKPIEVHHFKWNSVVARRIKARREYYKKLGMPNVPNLDHLVKYFQRNGGKINVRDRKLKVRVVKRPLGI